MDPQEVVQNRIYDKLYAKHGSNQVSRDTLIARINAFSQFINYFLLSKKQLKIDKFGMFKHTKYSENSLKGKAIKKREYENRRNKKHAKELKRIRLQQARSAKGLPPLIKWI